jgi:hypothetical protein
VTETKISHTSLPQGSLVPAQREAGKKTILSSVGVMVKATVLDAPYLETMVKHMLAQARYPFAERKIVVDRCVDFSGKYRSRPRLDQSSLDQVLNRLLTENIIDAVQEVDLTPSHVREIMGRYFYEHAERVPTHAFTGGPIYTTLFGMEAMKGDYVLQMDADILFHSGPASWVSQALNCLQEDPRIWLMMTHPGPPAGPPGQSLVGQNALSARWDPQSKLWRFSHATTRYFLCDRRRLHGQLSPIFQVGGCIPLEQCISQAMQHRGAFRGALGDLESWHLHVWYHGEPFPQWAPALTWLIEEGRFPEAQRGYYDLRLDEKTTRRLWATLVLQPTTYRASESLSHAILQKSPAPMTADPRATTNIRSVPDSEQPREEAPFAVVIPIRNRAGQRLHNTLASLNWQTIARPAQVLVVSHGSQPEVNRELEEICAKESAHLIKFGALSQPWNKPLALNTGIRATSSSIPFVMTMDADMILAPNFLEVVFRCLAHDAKKLILCRISDLDKHVTLPNSRDELLRDFQQIQATAKLRSPSGSGGIQAAARGFFFEIRGYDEDLLWWGAMDGDILNRARLLNMNIVWIENQTAMLHQWHPRKQNSLTDLYEIEQAQRYWVRNHQLVTSRKNIPYRNPQGWGGEADSV